MAVTIAYYISDYGYGHASRGVALIRAMLEQASLSGRKLKLLIACGRALPFLRQSLERDIPTLQAGGHLLEFRSLESEPGYMLRKGSHQADPAALQSAYLSYSRSLSGRIGREALWLAGSGARLVLSDIMAEAFPAAARAGIPSVGLSNFTWYTAYQDMLSPELLAPLAKAYLAMDRFVAFPGAREPKWSQGPEVRTGFFARSAPPREADELRKRLDPSGQRKLMCLFTGMDIGTVDLLGAMPLLEGSQVAAHRFLQYGASGQY